MMGLFYMDKMHFSPLKKELSWVLAVKMILLLVLWGLCFTHDGKTQQSDVAAVFFAGSEQGKAISDPKINGGNQ